MIDRWYVLMCVTKMDKKLYRYDQIPGLQTP